MCAAMLRLKASMALTLVWLGLNVDAAAASSITSMKSTCTGNLTESSKYVSSQTLDDKLKLLQVTADLKTGTRRQGASASSKRGCAEILEIHGFEDYDAIHHLPQTDGMYIKYETILNDHPVYKHWDLHLFYKEGKWVISTELDGEGANAYVVSNAECPAGVPQKEWHFGSDGEWVVGKYTIQITDPRAAGIGIFDLLDHPLDRDAVYHGVAKLGIGDKAVKVQMSPEGIIEMSKREPDELADDEFTMFVADSTAGYTASCNPGYVLKSSELRIKTKATLRDIARSWVLQQTGQIPDQPKVFWSPDKYNCQHFLRWLLNLLAAYPGKLTPMFETMMHNSNDLVDAVLNGGAAGGIARWSSGIMQGASITATPLFDVLGHADKFKDLLDVPIDSVRVIYSEPFSTWGTTNKKTRTNDFDSRVEKMCGYIKEKTDSNEGHFVESSPEQFPLRYTL